MGQIVVEDAGNERRVLGRRHGLVGAAGNGVGKEHAVLGVGAGEEFHVALVEAGAGAQFGGALVAVGGAVLVNAFGTVGGQALYDSEAEAQVFFLALQGVFPGAVVHIRWQHGYLVALGILYQLAGGVEPHGLAVEQGAVEGGRVVAFDPGGDVYQ